MIIPYFEEIKNQVDFKGQNWKWKFINCLYSEIIINNKGEEKVSFLNKSNDSYNLINLIIRLYFQNEWNYGSLKYVQLTNEIYASFASLSREGTIKNVSIKINENVDKYIKNDIIQLSSLKLDEFIKANEIIESLKTKYSNQESTLTELLLNI